MKHIPLLLLLLALPLDLLNLGCQSPDASNSSPSTLATSSSPAQVTLLRDDHGVPHIVASNLSSAMHGLGFAQAEDRLFQMFARRARMQGRTAEFFAQRADGTTSADGIARMIDSDHAMRLLAFSRHAERIVEEMGAEHRGLLESFAAGINAQIAERRSLGSAFDEFGIVHVEPWTVADTLLGWDSVGNKFGSSRAAAQLEIDRLNDCEDGGCTPMTCADYTLDEEAAVVQEPADGVWPPGGDGRRSPFASRVGLGELRPDVPLKASQGFVVAGRHLEGGMPLLFGEPQLSLEAPSVWYEHHIVVADEAIDVRGVGFAGSPGMAMFYSRNVSQTLTAGGGDTADLFEIRRGDDPRTYWVDGELRRFDMRVEAIRVRGGSPVEIVIEQTVFGPVFDDALDNLPAGRSFAIRHVAARRQGDHSVLAGIELMRAHNLEQYRNALRRWSSPTVNGLYAGVDDDDGETHIGYHALLMIPERAPLVIEGMDATGRYPYDGTTTDQDWDQFLDLDWNPHVIDPEEGYLFSGNHLTVGSWYDSVVYAGFQGSGDTFRSFELRQRLARLVQSGPIATSTLHALHVDSASLAVVGAMQALTELERRGTIPPDREDLPLSRAENRAARALTVLRMWFRLGDGRVDQRVPGNLFAAQIIPGLAQGPNVEPFMCRWGARFYGAMRFLREFGRDASVLGTLETAMLYRSIDRAIAGVDGAAWADSWGEAGWTRRVTSVPRTVAYQRDFACLDPTLDDELCSLDEAHTRLLTLPQDHLETIASTYGSSWPLTVDYSDVDGAWALLAPGLSERPSSPRFDSELRNIELKGRGDIRGMPNAPLDLRRLHIVERRVLARTP
jgi:acyl-homoserine lactone acylase PvdQ